MRIDFGRVNRWLRLCALVSRLLPAVTAAVFIITPGRAAETTRPINDFPNYNQNAYCVSISSLHEEGSRAARLAQCRTFEASSRQRLSAVWSSIPPTARANCQNQINGLSEGSYFLLSTCLVQEVANQLRATLAQSARDFPVYKPDLYCGASAETLTGESRSFILNTCLENERESRTKLDRVWNEVPQDIKAICGKQMDAFKDGSYFLLSICVVSEVAKRWLDNGGAIN